MLVRLLCVFLVVLALTGTVAGGTIRHDVTDASYTALAAGFPSVGDLTNGGSRCSATLIDPFWIVTAAGAGWIGLAVRSRRRRRG